MFRGHLRVSLRRESRVDARGCCPKHLGSSVCVCVCVCVSIFPVTHGSFMSVHFSKLVASHLLWRTSFQKCQTQEDGSHKAICGDCIHLSHCSGSEDKHSSSWSHSSTQLIVIHRFVHPQVYLQDTAQVHIEWAWKILLWIILYTVKFGYNVMNGTGYFVSL
jgi:hypothetical protein